jgi:hypothetical protein
MSGIILKSFLKPQEEAIAISILVERIKEQEGPRFHLCSELDWYENSHIVPESLTAIVVLPQVVVHGNKEEYPVIFPDLQEHPEETKISRVTPDTVLKRPLVAVVKN